MFSLGGFEEEEIVQDIGIVAAPVCSILFKSGIGIRMENYTLLTCVVW